jgi:O-antigen/teichoic acid export membrane protein
MNLALGAYLGVELVALVILLAVQHRLGCVALVRPDWRFYGQVLSYCLPLAAAYGAGMLSRWLDRLLIGRFFEPDRFAEYVNGAQELPFVAIITQSIAVAIMPNLVTLFQKGQVREMCGLFSDGVRRSSLMLLPIFVWALIASKDIIFVLYGPKYEESWYPFVIYLLVLPMRVGIFTSMLRAMGTTGPIVWGTLGAMVANLALGVSLIWLGGGGQLSFIGPAIANVVSLYLLSTYLVWLVRKNVRRHGYMGPILPVREYVLILGVSLAAGVLSLGAGSLVTELPLQGFFMNWVKAPLAATLVSATRICVCGAVLAAGFVMLGRILGVVTRQDWDLAKSIWHRPWSLFRHR